MTKRLLDEYNSCDDLENNDSLPYKCPKCGNKLVDITDTSNMTDGQMSIYLSGRDRTLECPNCGFEEDYDISEFTNNEDAPEEYKQDIGEFDLIEDIKFSYLPEYFFIYAKKAHEKKCYIESISLVHNLIENFIKNQFEEKIGKIKNKRNELLDKIDLLDSSKFKQLTNSEIKTKEDLKNIFIDEKNKFKQIYLSHWNYIGYLFEFFDFKTFNDIKEVNSKRNIAIHKLLNIKQSESVIDKYNSLEEISSGFIKIYDNIRKNIRESTYEQF